MSIDDRLRDGLLASTEHLHPGLEVELTDVLGRARRRRQVRATVTLGLAAAAIAVAAWLSGAPGREGTEPPAPIETPKGVVSSPIPMAGIHGDLAAGTYAMPILGLDPAEVLPDAVVDLTTGFDTPGGYFLYRVSDDDPDVFGLISYWLVDYIVPDPCRNRFHADLGPRVGDLVTALQAQKGRTTTAPRPIRLDGYRGVYLESTQDKDVDLNHCSGGQHALWRTAGDEGDMWYATDVAGMVDRFWILDIDGRRIVVAASTTPGETSSEIASVIDVVESTQFRPAADPTD